MADYKDGFLQVKDYRLSDFDVGLGMGALISALAPEPKNYTFQDRAALTRIAAFVRRSKERDTLFVTSEDPIFYVYARLLMSSKYSLEVEVRKPVKRHLKKSVLINELSETIQLKAHTDLRDLIPDFTKTRRARRVVIFIDGKEGDLIDWAVRQGKASPDSTLVLIKDYSLSKNPSLAPVIRDIGGMMDERADGLGEYIP